MTTPTPIKIANVFCESNMHAWHTLQSVIREDGVTVFERVCQTCGMYEVGTNEPATPATIRVEAILVEEEEGC